MITGLTTGTYYVRSYYATGYVDQIYNGINCLTGCPAVTTGTGIGVTTGVDTAGINLSLLARGTMTGTVRDRGTSLPLPGV